jgi:hypothetical protein
MNEFKPDITAQVLLLAAGRVARFSSAIMIKGSTGLNLVEASRFWGPGDMDQIQEALVLLALQYGHSLRCEKFVLQMSFPSPIPVPEKNKNSVKGSSAQKELWHLWQGFRLARIEPQIPLADQIALRSLAELANPRLK